MIEFEGPVSDSTTRIGKIGAEASTDGFGAGPEEAGVVSLSVLDAALDYHERGFSLLPLRGKAPASDLIRKTHGTSSTTTLASRGAGEEQLHAWFADPDINVGVFCGQASGGLVVVDFDECEFPPADVHLPPTATVKTGRDARRGYHLYYRSDTEVPNETHAWGEVRAQAPYYVVASPSLHDSGLRYTWQRPLDVVPPADFADVRLPAHAKSARTNASTHKTHIRPTKAFLLGHSPTGDQGKDRWLRSFDRDLEAVGAMAKALGIEAPLGKPFRCILHEEKNASAVLTQAAESGEWLYRDFHAPARGGAEWLSLAQVRAQLSRRGPTLSAPEHATWKLVLLDEAGLVPRQAVAADRLPGEVPAPLAHVYERFVYLLGCRWNYDHGAPAPFERKFAAAFCGVPEKTARVAIEELERLKQIVVVADHGRTRLWLPAGVAPNASSA